MDADSNSSHGDYITRREKRWSMNSQRLEEIVAELMRPISDLRRSFDTDLSALLEEYLTEAGLHALDTAERSEGDEAASGSELVAPNFAELALLLQQSACIYGRKVDYLYQHVLSVSDSLHNNTVDETVAEDTLQSPSTRRKRKASEHGFSEIVVEAAAAARGAGGGRPPPTLPRQYLQLEPRQPSSGDIILRDYSGEPVGMLQDYYVARPIRNGLLGGPGRGGAGARPRPAELRELQDAITAAAPPPSPPPASPLLDTSLNETMQSPQPQDMMSPPPTDMLSPPPTDMMSPPPTELMPPPLTDAMPPPPAPTDKLSRKRKNECKTNDVINIEDLTGVEIKMALSIEGANSLKSVCEFTIPAQWVSEIVAKRRARILRLRNKMRRPPDCDFQGFTEDQRRIAEADVLEWRKLHPELFSNVLTRLSDSEDDGFFEQSSLGECDTTPPIPTSKHDHSLQMSLAKSWARGDERSLCVPQLCGRLLAALPDTPDTDVPDRTSDTDTDVQTSGTSFSTALRTAAKDERDVSALLLAALFMANSGNVEIIPGPPLSMSGFSLKVVNRDPSLYNAAAAADPTLVITDPTISTNTTPATANTNS